MTDIAVVILNYNGEKLLPKFLPSVVRHSGGALICVADNGSTDHSIHFLRREFPQVKILELGGNFGFCGGYNKALAHIEARYFVLLNSDVEVTAGWLEPLKQVLDADATIAAVQPKILSYQHRELFEYAGAGGGFIDALGYPFCRGRIFDHVERDSGQYNDTIPVFWSSGACMMIRAERFHEHGGFDEDFFAHMEEIDLCWKLNRSGNKVYYCGDSQVYHLGAGTLGYHNPRKTYLNFRNGLALIIKHLDSRELFYKLPLRLALDWVAAVLFLLRGQGHNFISVLRAHFDLVLRFKGLIRKRKLIAGRHPTYSRGTIHQSLIIFDYYIRKRKTYPLQ